MRGEREHSVNDWLEHKPPPDLVILLSCPTEVAMHRMAGIAAQSDKLDDDNADATRERLLQSRNDELDLLHKFRDTHSPILVVDTDRDMETVKAELFSQMLQVFEECRLSRQLGSEGFCTLPF
ncbi:putative Adenylate kinase active site lid domain-containing protein [Seiridium cardinale]|uniref:Adenylate kinase active site lid domain-containing protein n=1 Tax=Seiridium cardinale TaxID=138064 RepID=A0ABR2XQB3_9PEZI